MSTLHGRPSLDELLEATREFLADVLAPTVAAEHAFHLRVAVNVLDIARRELALGDRQNAAHAERLARLGFADDRALADAIRADTIAEHADVQVRDAVMEDIVARLAVANPSYLDSAPTRRGVTTSLGDQPA